MSTTCQSPPPLLPEGRKGLRSTTACVVDILTTSLCQTNNETSCNSCCVISGEHQTHVPLWMSGRGGRLDS
eukprot:6481812-Amphidinium_carterae.1